MMVDSEKVLAFKQSDRRFRRFWTMIGLVYVAVLIVPLIIVRPPLAKLVWVAPIAVILTAGYGLTRWFSARLNRDFRFELSSQMITVAMAGKSLSLAWEEITAISVGRGWLGILGPTRTRRLSVNMNNLECESSQDFGAIQDVQTKILDYLCRRLGITQPEMEKAKNHPLHKMTLPVTGVTFVVMMALAYWGVVRSHLSKNTLLLLAVAFGLIFGLILSLMFRNAGLIKVQRGVDLKPGY